MPSVFSLILIYQNWQGSHLPQGLFATPSPPQLMQYHRTLPALATGPTGIGGFRILVPCRGVEPLLAGLESASPPRATKLSGLRGEI